MHSKTGAQNLYYEQNLFAEKLMRFASAQRQTKVIIVVTRLAKVQACIGFTRQSGDRGSFLGGGRLRLGTVRLGTAAKTNARVWWGPQTCPNWPKLAVKGFSLAGAGGVRRSQV